MKASTILFSLCMLLIISACQPTQQSAQVEAKEKVESIQLFAQARPGGEAFDFDMPIDKGLDKLEVVSPEETEIDSNELILGLTIGEKHLALPIRYMSGFEVANLFLDSQNYLLTWCPLVGSARIFEGAIEGDKSGFDFGRGLIENNLLIVDRNTQTVWNQLSCKGVQGELEGNSLTPLPSIQSTWSFWQQKHPDTQVLMNRDTSEAVFPSSVLVKQYYHTWEPGKRYSEGQGIHNLQNVGLGLAMDTASVFFPLEKLFEEASPLDYQIEGENVRIFIEESGLTAWAEDQEGNILPATIVYDWAWKNFFPDSHIF